MIDLNALRAIPGRNLNFDVSVHGVTCEMLTAAAEVVFSTFPSVNIDANSSGGSHWVDLSFMDGDEYMEDTATYSVTLFLDDSVNGSEARQCIDTGRALARPPGSHTGPTFTESRSGDGSIAIAFADLRRALEQTGIQL